jgi:hypothetical protein
VHVVGIRPGQPDVSRLHVLADHERLAAAVGDLLESQRPDNVGAVKNPVAAIEPVEGTVRADVPPVRRNRPR